MVPRPPVLPRHNASAATGLGMLERQRVKVWLNRAYGEMAARSG